MLGFILGFLLGLFVQAVFAVLEELGGLSLFKK